jgi:hypothetical protein
LARPIANGEMRIKDLVRFVEALKERTPCMDCGRKYPYYVMDFDHTRGVKIDGISRMIRMAKTVEWLQTEIDKCDLVCANCHRERTHKRVVQRRASR